MKLLSILVICISLAVMAHPPSAYESSKYDSINMMFNMLMEANAGTGFNSAAVQNGYSSILTNESHFLTFFESHFSYQRGMFADYIEYLSRSKNTDPVFLEAQMGMRITIAILKDVVSFSTPRGDREQLVEDYSNRLDPLSQMLPLMSDEQFEWFKKRLIEEFLLNRTASKRILKLKLDLIGLNAVENAFKFATEHEWTESKTQEFVERAKLQAEEMAIRNTVYLIDPLLMELLMLTRIGSNVFRGSSGTIALGMWRAQSILHEVAAVDRMAEVNFLKQIILDFKPVNTCLIYFK